MTFLMKIVLAGDGGVGKTALRERYLGRGFQSKYMMTIGADFALKETTIDGKSIKFQIWDLAGQQRFNAVRSVYYLGCLGGLLLFDVTRKESFEACAAWVKEIWTNNGKGTIPLVLLGNKSDLRDAHPDSISPEVAQRYADKLSEQAKQYGFGIHYMDTSAKTGLNVGEAFEELGKVYFQYLEKQRKKD
ncbi:MAG: GTPase KRas precursor [Candidatus Heimdallarchaeota archaeon LC_3]|nr:MAG: GTPase KRas precursor [Candidatus Heimdallarchaeota archaeon LC_3]